MDPNSNLAEQLSLARQIADLEYGHDYAVDLSNRLAELVLALDGWLSNGNALPFRWMDK
jgi:hypothetical protein